MPRPLASLLLLLTALIWGLAFVAQKRAMEAMGPLTFNALRYLIGGVLVLPVGLAERRRAGGGPARKHWPMLLGLGFVFFMGAWLQQAGLGITTATNGGFLTALYVLFTPLIGLIALGYRPHPVVWAAIPAALIGIFLLNGGQLDRMNAGDALVLVSAVFWALQVAMLGPVVRATGLPVFVSAVGFLFVGLVSLAFMPFFETVDPGAILAGWPEIAYAGVLATGLAFSLQAIGQRYVPPPNAAIVLSGESLFAALGGALFLGERLPLPGYVGALMIFAAIVAVEAVPALARAGKST